MTSIGTCAFYGCSGLTSVTIPASVTSIGSSAFKGCSGLTSFVIGSDNVKYSSSNGLLLSKDSKTLIFGVNGDVTIPASVTSIGADAFSGCSGLTSVTIPDSVTSIGDGAFSGCNGLTSVTIPDSVTSIGSSAFDGCSGLTSVTIPNSVTRIKDFAFEDCSGLTSVTIPDSVTSIGIYAFNGCSGLTSVTIPASVKSIGYYAFFRCTKLASVTMQGDAPSVGYGAFYAIYSACVVYLSSQASGYVVDSDGEWQGIKAEYYGPEFTINENGVLTGVDLHGYTEVVIPDRVKSIGDKAFYGCSTLTSVTIPDSVTNVGQSAFSGCSSLTSVTIPASVTIIGDYAFSGCDKIKNVTVPGRKCGIPFDGVTNLVISAGTTSIGWYAFNGCSCLTSVTIPNSVTSIGGYAFEGCSSLASITIPDGVTSIGSSAFSGCSGLTSVTIPDSVTSIGKSAFSGCSGLTAVYISNLAAWCETSFYDATANPCYYAKNLYLNGELITELRIPDGVTSIGANAFFGCRGIVSVIIPDSVTSIGKDAFFWCMGLTGVYMFDLTAWCEVSFYNSAANPLLYARYLYLDGELVSDLTVPSSINSVGAYAFERCSGIKSIVIPDGVTSIGDYAFSECGSVNSVVIPDSVTTIGACAFSRCSDMTSVVIPYSVTSIGENAFSKCDSIEEIYLPSEYEGLTFGIESSDAIVYYNPVVQLDADGGEVEPHQIKVTFGKCYGDLPTPVRNGYVFQGWKYDDEFVDSNTVVTATAGHKLVAQWKANQYTVTFDANGGVGGCSEVLDCGSELTAPTVSRIGYTFNGWSPSVDAVVPANDVTYTAQWILNKYTVKFDANGGVGGWSEERDYDSEIEAPAVSRVGYTFVGWLPEVATTVSDEDITYIAQWVVNQYTATFDANGGVGGGKTTQDFSTILSAPSVTRIGYEFAGWVPEVPAAMPAEDITYTAQWTPRKYLVTFNANGGEGGWSEMRDYASAIAAPIVTRVGYDFGGWKPNVAATVPNANITYTAQWTVHKHTVTFDANGGEGGWSDILDYGMAITTPTVERAHYTFVGWQPAVAATVPDDSVVYVAQWKLNSHTVTFDANGGVGGWSQVMDYGADIITPEVSRIGYTFGGWSPAVATTVPDENVTYVAQWTPEKYLVTFNANGGEGGWSELRDYDSEIIEPIVVRTGYDFVGWSPAVPELVPNADVEYVAQWEIRKHTVTFDANGGEGGWSDILDYGTAITTPTVGRAHYTFVGWQPAVAATVPDASVTYVAQWKLNSHTVTFAANGGIGGWSQKMDYDAEIIAPEVSRIGYTFSGWTPAVAATVPDEDVTYMAQWTPEKYLVTFDANGGEGGWSEALDYDSEIVAPTVSRVGYDFVGWLPAVAATVPNANVSYTAQWEVRKHAVTFDANGGEGGWSNIMDYGASITAPTVERVHYTFIGWQPEVAVTVPDECVTYVAQWKINSHVVAFDANGGIGGWSQVMDYGADIIAPTVSRIGYTFSGWSPDVAATAPDENVTYVAQWTPEKYRVTFYANGGEGGWSEMRDYDSEIVAPTVSRVGYDFVGWSPTVVATVPNADVAYVAQWEIRRHTVTFDANGGTGGWSELMDYGSAITAPTVTRVGYKFKGWSQEVASTVPDADVTYVAQWTLEKYLVTFDANGGEGGWVKVMGYNSDMVAPTVTRTGYDFAGWLPDVAEKVPNDNVSYVAQWIAHKHNVTFDANGGKGGWSGLRDYGTAIVAPEVTRSGYEFTGWTPEVAATVPDEDVCYVAQWVAKTYTIRFMPNGGDGAMEDEPFTVNVAQALSSNLFGRDGYVFLGWAKSADGNIAEYVDCEVVENISNGDVPMVELFAVWARNTTNVELGFGGDKTWRMDKATHNGCVMWRSGDVDDDEASYAECTVSGPGTVSFWWKSSCEGYFYGSYRLDGVTFSVDGGEKAYANGETDWTNCIVRVNGSGSHTLTWTYEKDVSDAEGEDCAWLSEIVWTPMIAPSIDGDDGMTVEGDSESGFIVKPSEYNTDVVVTIPDGVEPEKVTVEVAATVETVTANGANVKVMKGEYDIAEHLDLEAVTQDGVINLASAQVKEEVAKEALDTEKGAEIDISDPESPELTTSETKPGLTYTLLEGATLEEMMSCTDGDSKVGDGKKWTPNITVKGGTSGFYTIKVEK